jgi:hypothetical protein
MNGADVIEGLRVIKIPYADLSDITSVDLKAGVFAFS